MRVHILDCKVNFGQVTVNWGCRSLHAHTQLKSISDYALLMGYHKNTMAYCHMYVHSIVKGKDQAFLLFDVQSS